MSVVNPDPQTQATSTRVEMAPSRAPKARIRWFVYAGPDEHGRLVKMPRTATMRGHWPGYDAECSCGWETGTGGAIRNYVQREVWLHKRLDCLLRPQGE